MLILLYSWGTQWHSWLRHCTTSRKVVGLTGMFHWHNPSGPGVTSASTSTRNISWGIKVAYALPQPPGTLRTCPGVALPLPLHSHCYTATFFSPQGAIHRKYWYILWAGSTKYTSRCKSLEIRKHLHVSYMAYKNIKYNIQGVYNRKSLDMKIKI
jgi:hypothetical protein